jgi:hypothetical protein
VLTRIHSEIFDQGKILPPKSKLDLSFLLVDNKNFVILTNQATPYKVTLQKMQLLVRYITIDESIINEMEYITTRGDNMVMPLRKVEMSYFTKQAHTRDWSELNLVKEGKTLPRRLFIAFVPQANFQGDAKLDPFDYHPSNIERVVLRIGGQIMPFPELYCTPAGGDNRNVVWPLYALLKTCNSFLEERDIGLTVENYTKGNFVLGFDLTSGSAPLGEAFEMPNESSIQLEIKLSAAPANAHTMIVYAEYDGELEIDRTGKVMMYE